MKRRLFLLLGASTLTVTSLVGFTTANAVPAAAAPNNIFVSIGYIIQCLTPQHLINDFAVCLVNAIKELTEGLALPTSLGTSANAKAAPKLPGTGTNAPALNLPGNVNSILQNLPSSLRTNPVASAPTVNLPLTQLVPTLSPRAGISSLGSLPKLPTIAPIKFLNASDSKAPASSPVSGTDAIGLAGLVLLGLGALRFRRASVIAAS